MEEVVLFLHVPFFEVQLLLQLSELLALFGQVAFLLHAGRYTAGKFAFVVLDQNVDLAPALLLKGIPFTLCVHGDTVFDGIHVLDLFIILPAFQFKSLLHLLQLNPELAEEVRLVFKVFGCLLVIFTLHLVELFLICCFLFGIILFKLFDDLFMLFGQ